jgi:hypothetical protein
MKPVLGILLAGGGVFLIVALFNGTLHFPIGNMFGGTDGNVGGGSNPGGILGTGILAGAPANLPGNTPITAVKPTQGAGGTMNCPPGYVKYLASGGNPVCIKK